MQVTVDSGAFDSLWYSMIMTSVSLVLYGVYVNLFLLSMYTLSRRKTVGTTLLRIASCMLAVVGSMQLALDVAGTVTIARIFQRIVYSEVLTARSRLLLPQVESTESTTLLSAKIIAIAINNFITDLIFLYRCFVIWGYQKKPIILPGLLMLSTLIVASVGGPTHVITNVRSVTITLGATTNLVLTALTGNFLVCGGAILSFSSTGRILWIQRAASHVALDSTTRGRYTRAVTIILESGTIYCAVAILLVASALLDDEIFIVGFGIAQHLLNIIPTFTPVYIGLKNMEENQTADLERGSKLPPSQHEPLHLRRSCADVQVDL
ncbi:hypothetical protein DFH08DRAFT_313505 [Mycena albidolilacea]|uniref:Uncharacterized protein n=1 Tax=Mycena albidolilacea TaxID=1033008 RepID=A0AAD6ZMT4_9AGAR|nr:hypothetical protein DFH08DRAFT_313505 [Mycena albidolilacea]